MKAAGLEGGTTGQIIDSGNIREDMFAMHNDRPLRSLRYFESGGGLQGSNELSPSKVRVIAFPDGHVLGDGPVGTADIVEIARGAGGIDVRITDAGPPLA